MLIEFRCQIEERVEDLRSELCESVSPDEFFPAASAVDGTETSFEYERWWRTFELARGNLIDSLGSFITSNCGCLESTWDIRASVGGGKKRSLFLTRPD